MSKEFKLLFDYEEIYGPFPSVEELNRFLDEVKTPQSVEEVAKHFRVAPSVIEYQLSRPESRWRAYNRWEWIEPLI